MTALARLALLVLVACGPGTPSDRELCEQRERAYERAYPDMVVGSDHATRVASCTRGVADEHKRDVDADGKDMFQRRVACARHLGKGTALEGWSAMKDCESKTLFLD